MTLQQRLEMGMAHHRAGRLREAETAYRQVLAEQPDQVDALQLLGSLSADLGRLDVAMELLRKAIQINPNVAQYHANLGAIYARNKRFDEAAAALHRAIELDPGMAAAHYNLGGVFLAQFEFARAIAVFQRAIALNPGWPELHNNLGLALRNEARHEEALVAFKRALALRPDYADAHWNLSWTLLMLGDFSAGWAEYEWRMKCPAVATPRAFAQPQWRGQELAGRTILLHAEQGFGDMLQVVRYVPLVAKRGGTVIVECRSELARLFRTVPGIAQIVVQGEMPPAFDVQCPMMSLPLAFGTTLQTIPAEVPYLTPPPDRLAAWRERLGDHDGRLRVGLVWAGRPTQQYDRWRSGRFEYFAPLAKVKSARFFSLQKGPAATQAAAAPPEMQLLDWSNDLHDFAETAALIANLDLVIGIESAVTHLAGAMGKPVWAVLAHVADWRYLLNRSDSPWYPTMRLFRQPAPGGWDSVMAQVAAALEQETRR
ncbi:MAG: tetratricopeptide repeat-containing glycosyltransferase family protein [Tepidisphaeraceae bacterium]